MYVCLCPHVCVYLECRSITFPPLKSQLIGLPVPAKTRKQLCNQHVSGWLEQIYIYIYIYIYNYTNATQQCNAITCRTLQVRWSCVWLHGVWVEGLRRYGMCYDQEAQCWETLFEGRGIRGELGGLIYCKQHSSLSVVKDLMMKDVGGRTWWIGVGLHELTKVAKTLTIEQNFVVIIELHEDEEVYRRWFILF